MNDSTQITQEERDQYIEWLKSKNLYLKQGFKVEGNPRIVGMYFTLKDGTTQFYPAKEPIELNN